MRPSATPGLLAAALWLAPVAGSAAAQELDLPEVFSNERFHEVHGILRGRGELAFVADVWLLPGSPDSARALIGIALSNETLEFVRTQAGTWRSVYAVTVAARRDGRPVVDETWERSVEVGSFEETLLTGETIVFQTEIGLPSGAHELTLVVHDRNSDDSSVARTSMDVPAPAETPPLAEPVPLKLYRDSDGDIEYVVHPSHYYPGAPDRFDFMVVLADAGWVGPVRIRARLVPERRHPEESTPTWTARLGIGSDRVSRAFGSIENVEPRFGEYALEVVVSDSAGHEIGRSATPLLISGSSAWIIDRWDRALELIRHEALPEEIEILRDVGTPAERIAAWSCFWRIRDPAPGTASNEALQDYLRRVRIANQRWTHALKPGFLTDRGRVYVTLGPPDVVLEERSPGEGVVWTYRERGFQLRFVDRIGFGDYELDHQSAVTHRRELARVEARKRRLLGERAVACPLLAAAFE